MKIVLSGVAAGALVVSAASADVTISFVNQTWTGGSFSDLTAAFGGFSGTLTGVSVNATLVNSTNYTYADDLCIYVDVAPLSLGGLLQVGGFDDLGAAERRSWRNGADSAPGTTVLDAQTLSTALTFTGSGSDPNIYLGNGFIATGTAGVWTGSITLIGVNAVPAPGAIALLGLAGLAGRRRR